MPRPELDEPTTALPEVTARDFVMARLAASRTFLQCAIDAIDDAISNCVDPEDDDEDGEERDDLIEAALEHVGEGSRSLEAAQAGMAHIDPEEGETFDDEPEPEPDPEPLPKATARKRRRS